MGRLVADDGAVQPVVGLLVIQRTAHALQQHLDPLYLGPLETQAGSLPHQGLGPYQVLLDQDAFPVVAPQLLQCGSQALIGRLPHVLHAYLGIRLGADAPGQHVPPQELIGRDLHHRGACLYVLGQLAPVLLHPGQMTSLLYPVEQIVLPIERHCLQISLGQGARAHRPGQRCCRRG